MSGDASKTGLVQGGALGDDWGDGIGTSPFSGGAGELIAAARTSGATVAAIRWQQGWRLNKVLTGTGWLTKKRAKDDDDKSLRPTAVQKWVYDHIAVGHGIGSYGCSGGNNTASRGWLRHGLHGAIRHVLIGGGAGWNTAAGCACLPGQTRERSVATMIQSSTREAIDYQFQTDRECQGEPLADPPVACPECRDGDCTFPLSSYGAYPAAWDSFSLDPRVSGVFVDLTIPPGSRFDLLETAYDHTSEGLFAALSGDKRRHTLPGGGHCDWTKKGWGSRTACLTLQEVQGLAPSMCAGFCGYQTEPCTSDADCCGARSCVAGACSCVPADAPCDTDQDCCNGLACRSGACRAE